MLVSELEEAVGPRVLQGATGYDDLWQAVGHICDLFTPQQCWNDFKAAQCVAE